MKKLLKFLPILLVLVMACDKTPDGEIVKQDLVVGTGALGAIGKTWKVHYVGRLKGKLNPDSTIFESTRTDNKPFSFVFDGTLSPDGFELGIEGMAVGGKRKITIPYHLGFGTTGVKDAAGNFLVKPKQDIIYEVELLSLPEIEKTDVTTGGGTLAESGKLANITYVGRYHGTTTVFDQNNTGFSFRLGQGTVIPGFDQGVSGMRAGGSRKIVIPPHLGYGSRGAGYNPATGTYSIRPHETIEFDVTLVSVE